MLTERGELVLKNNKIADTFNQYFETIAEDLDLIIGRTILNFLQILNLLIESITLSRNTKSSEHEKHQKAVPNFS